jgi:hypothetical protein
MENGKMITRFKGLSFTETAIDMTARYSKMNLMARRVFISMRKGTYTKETSTMAGFMAKGPILSLMAPNTQASGTRAKNMESESLSSLMKAFTKVAMKMINKMGSASFGSPMAPSIKVISRITNERASNSSITRNQGTQLRLNIKMTKQRDSSHSTSQTIA